MSYIEHLKEQIKDSAFEDWVGRRPEELKTSIGNFIVTEKGRIRSGLHKTINSAKEMMKELELEAGEVWKWDGKEYRRI
jgi:hypothetical protein